MTQVASVLKKCYVLYLQQNLSQKCSYQAHVNMNLNMGRVSPAISHLVFVATISSLINYSVEPKTKELFLMYLMFFSKFSLQATHGQQRVLGGLT